MLGDMSSEGAEWICEAADVMNILQDDVLLFAGESHPLPDNCRSPFGYDLEVLLQHLPNNTSMDLGHIYLGNFPTRRGRAVAMNGMVAVASAAHLMLLEPNYAEDVMKFHLLFRTAISMAAGTLTCDEKECLFHEPDAGWPLFVRICTNSMKELYDRNLDADQISFAARIIANHRDELDEIATIERTAREQIPGDGLDEEIAKHESDIDVLVQKFATRRVSKELLVNWLKLIGRTKEIGPACKLLHAVLYIDWQQMTDIFNDLLKKLPKDREHYTIVPFGHLADSPQIIDYILGHDTRPPDVQPLSTALSEIENGTRAANLIFADDSVFSGRQAHWVLRQYFGLPIEGSRKPYVKELTEKEKKILKNSQVEFLCAVADPEGIELLNETAQELGLKFTLRFGRVIHPNASRAFDPGSLIFATQNERILARNMAFRIGRSLLMSGSTVRQIDTIHDANENALGWDGMEQLVVFPWSTPKLTLTMLWKHGNYVGKPWIPLFPLLTE